MVKEATSNNGSNHSGANASKNNSDFNDDTLNGSIGAVGTSGYEIDADSKETRLTLMEEVLLLGLKDKEVTTTEFMLNCCSTI